MSSTSRGHCPKDGKKLDQSGELFVCALCGYTVNAEAFSARWDRYFRESGDPNNKKSRLELAEELQADLIKMDTEGK